MVAVKSEADVTPNVVDGEDEFAYRGMRAP